MKVYVVEESIDYEGICDYTLYKNEDDAKKHQLREIDEEALTHPRWVDKDNSYKLGREYPTVGGTVRVVEVEIK